MSDSEDNWLNAAIDQAYDSILITSSDLDFPGPTILYANKAFCQTTGYQLDELLGQTPRILQGDLTDKKVLKRLRENLEHHECFEGSTINYRKNREPYVVRWNISPIKDAEGNTLKYLSIQRDITHEVELETFNQRLMESLGEGVFGIDVKGDFTYVNPAGLKILKYASSKELIGKNSHQLTHGHYPNGQVYPEHQCPIYRVLQTGTPLNAWRDAFINSEGSYVPVEVSVTPMSYDDGGVFGGVVIFRDISSALAIEKTLEYEATHDQLTGICNRRFSDILLEQEMERAKSQESALSVMMIDIDFFKDVNDRYGHQIGDQVLIQLPELIKKHIRSTDSLARWGGEEFLIILPNATLNGAEKLAEEIRRRFADFKFPVLESNITVSIGIATFHKIDTLHTIIKRADDALYRAKRNGRNRVEVEHSLNPPAVMVLRQTPL